MIVYPRLTSTGLNSLLLEFEKLGDGDEAILSVRGMIDESIKSKSRISHSAAGTQLVDDSHLELIRSELRKIADEFNFPHSKPSGGWAEYDRLTAKTLHELAGMSPSDAASKEVWAHMNGWLCADLVYWRWGRPNQSVEGSLARFGSGARWSSRNQMGRLWWRAEIMGDVYFDRILGEDQLTAILERPSLGFNPPLAKAIAMEWSRSVLDDPNTIDGEELMRDATKRLRRLLPVVAIYSLNDTDLREIVSQAFLESATVLSRDSKNAVDEKPAKKKPEKGLGLKLKKKKKK